MPFAVDREVMNFRLESFALLSGRAGKINEHAAGINHIDPEAVGFEPGSELVEIGLRHSKLLTEFLRGQPMMKIWRTLGVEFIDELLQGFFLFRGALQLQEYVLYREVVCYGPAIVFKDGFGTRVSFEHDATRFIDALRDSRARWRA